MSLTALLHDDGEPIIVSGSEKLSNGDTKWWNQYAQDRTKADRFGINIQRNAYCRHGIHDGTIRDADNRPDCRVKHFTGSRTFFIDIDAGTGHKSPQYQTLNEAVVAFKSAIMELCQLGLPRPNLIQFTGGGLQAAWVTDTVYPQAEWSQLMRILFLLLKKFRLELDANLTSIDRGIRYCGEGYVNVNYGDPKPTKIIHIDNRINGNVFQNVLKQHGQIRVVPAKKQKSEYDIEGFEFQFDITAIADECKVVQEAVNTGGKDHDRRHWINLVSLAAKNHDETFGRSAAHAVSSQHPDYDADEVDGKFDEFRNSEIKGYITCEKLGLEHRSLCQSCAYYQKIISPAKIQGLLRSKATAIEPHQFNGAIIDSLYFNSEQGIRRLRLGTETADPMVWTGVRIDAIQLELLDGDSKQEYLAFECGASDRANHNRRISVDIKRLQSVTSMATALGENSVIIGHDQQKGMQKAMVSWVEKLRKDATRTIRYTRLGWTESRDGFVLGEWLYRRDGEREPIQDTLSNLRNHNTHGSSGYYDELINNIISNEHRPDAHALIAAAFSSVLLEIIGASGIALNFYSIRSGFGKTTLSNLAASIWGNPRDLMFTLNDTENSVIRRIAILNNIAAFYDELQITPDNARAVINLIFRLNSNMEKSRLDGSSRVQERGDWRTPMIFTTNYSFIDLIRKNRSGRGGDAGLARVMDFVLSPLPDNARDHMAEVAMVLPKLHENNGWPGHKFVPYVVANQDNIEKRLTQTINLLVRLTQQQDNSVFSRNQIFIGATMLVAARIVNVNNIFPIDERKVLTALVAAIGSVKTTKQELVVANDPLNVVRDYMVAMEKHRVTTIAANGKIEIDMHRMQPVKPWAYEVKIYDKTIMLPVLGFIEWLRQQEYPYGNSILEVLRQTYKPQSRRLCENVPRMSGPYQEIIVLPAVGALKGFFD